MSHNSDAKPQDLPFRLTGSQAKTAYALEKNLASMIEEFGLETIGFLTLTVGDAGADGFEQVWDSAEASRRIDSLRRGVLSSLFARAIIVTERHKSGAIHFHVVGALASGADIRTGYDHAAAKRKDYRSASVYLRQVWAMLRERCPEYGFGRPELEPVRTNGEAVARYVSKYVEKNLFNRLAEDKGKKLVRYHGWKKRQLKPNDFAWANARAAAWRTKAAQLAALGGVRRREEVAEAFGPRWAYSVTRVMQAVDDRPVNGFEWTFPERECARMLVRRECARARWLREYPWKEAA